MSRVRMFVAATVAAAGLVLAAQPAGAVIINGQIGEPGSTPSDVPPPSGAIAHICLTIRPNPTPTCIDI